MYKKFYPIKPFLVLLLFLASASTALRAQQASLTITRTNTTAGGSADNPGVNNILKFTITAKNTGSTTLTNVKLYNAIPAGVTYQLGTTRVNNVPVPDASGKMRFSNPAGTLIGTGSLAAGATTTIDFNAQVSASAGFITDYATLRGTQGVNNIVQNATGASSHIDGGPKAGIIYQVTDEQPDDSTYYVLRDQFGTFLYNGRANPCFDALTGVQYQSGSLLSDTRAIAMDITGQRLYFINRYQVPVGGDLNFIYFPTNNNPNAQTYSGFQVEPDLSGPGYIIDKMTAASNGFFYALTDNGQDLTQFSITSSGAPNILNLGPLVNDPSNGANDVLAETGGDLFAASEGKLYLLSGSGKLYRINPATLVTLYMGTISNLPASGIKSAAMDNNGTLYIGGNFPPSSGVAPSSIFTANLVTMTATLVGASGYINSDFASVNIPVLAHLMTANQSYLNKSGHLFVLAGDTVEYSIEVGNIGNMSATNVKVFDTIPGFAHYLANSTTMNGVPVADVNGKMPFTVTGGRLVNSTGATTGMVVPGNNVVIKFQVTTDPLKPVCNYPQVIYPGIDGAIITLPANMPAQNGIESNCFFSDGVICGCTPMFTGTLSNNQPLLQWSVEKEDNIDHYEVEYAAGNSSQFNPVARVNSGITKLPKHQLIDKSNPLTGLSNYRLKVVQKSGQITYSDTVQLSPMGSVRVRPNPFHEDLNLQVQLKTAEQVQVRLVDINGRTVLTTREKLNAGANTMNIKAPAALAPGIYVLELMVRNQRLSQQKLVKQ
ncbi:DUF11 domain-containing protein [Chitinophaga agrisoli]|uniref:DUF11 domain-containing protein n=1 Tax=Chitinophaga agrisoli TaxID=2607653 RepID=A0A5B2VKN6_9BACT|nr:T9SS type A sorting domain-containing protein [Chitinophaga agrisoli]KAA2238769.1 DUF11 domain-containing protein [Chitinophaga agrisoli]